MKKLTALFVSFSLSSITFGQSYSYKCFSYYWNGYEHEKGTMTLSVSSTSAKAKFDTENFEEEVGGKLDRNYKPRGGAPYVKFGRTLIVEKALLKGGRELKEGDLGGLARVEGEAEGGFYQYKFVCRR